MDASYVQLTELPVEVPELHEFVGDLYLTAAKQQQLVALLEAINQRSAVHAVKYCTQRITDQRLREEAQRHYEEILDRQSFVEEQHSHDIYLAIYANLRKQCLGYVYWTRNLFHRTCRLMIPMVEAFVLHLKRISERTAL